MSKRRRKLPTFLRPAESDALLSAAHCALNGAKTQAKRHGARRDVAMVATGLYAGLRVAELCALEVEHIDLAGGFLQVHEGKGKKDRTLPIGGKLLMVLRDWIGDRTRGMLFAGPKGKWLSERTFHERLATLGKAAGLRRCNPHALRHTFACRLLESGASIVEVSELLGHSSVAVTSLYLHALPERLRGAMDRL
jgi:integrase/recombinase XerC